MQRFANLLQALLRILRRAVCTVNSTVESRHFAQELLLRWAIGWRHGSRLFRRDFERLRPCNFTDSSSDFLEHSYRVTARQRQRTLIRRIVKKSRGILLLLDHFH